MIVLGGELASEVSQRQTELASKPPKTLIWLTQRRRSKPSETHRIVLSLATETPLLEGVGQRQSFLR